VNGNLLQVDNEMVFWGSTRYPRGMGCLIRLCLNNRCSPVFIPTSEPWRNGIVEKFNDHLQDKCLRRTIIDSHSTLIEATLQFGEQIKVPSSLIYEYALATIDVKEQTLKIYDANFMPITKLPYILRP